MDKLISIYRFDWFIIAEIVNVCSISWIIWNQYRVTFEWIFLRKRLLSITLIWFMIHDSWFMIHDSLFMIRDFYLLDWLTDWLSKYSYSRSYPRIRRFLLVDSTASRWHEFKSHCWQWICSHWIASVDSCHQMDYSSILHLWLFWLFWLFWCIK
jgi:hypothetical protein